MLHSFTLIASISIEICTNTFRLNVSINSRLMKAEWKMRRRDCIKKTRVSTNWIINFPLFVTLRITDNGENQIDEKCSIWGSPMAICIMIVCVGKLFCVHYRFFISPPHPRFSRYLRKLSKHKLSNDLAFKIPASFTVLRWLHSTITFFLHRCVVMWFSIAQRQIFIGINGVCVNEYTCTFRS